MFNEVFVASQQVVGCEALPRQNGCFLGRAEP